MDNISITLPVSGKTVTIRNYTTKADDTKADAVLYAGVTATKEGKINFPLTNILGSTTVYVERLVVDIDGDDKNIITRLEELRSKDYLAIQEAVEGVVSANSPKAKKTA